MISKYDTILATFAECPLPPLDYVPNHAYLTELNSYLNAAEGEAASERAFKAYRRRLYSVEEFRYLGGGLTATDDDWPAVARNLHRARTTWGRLARMLGREGADPKVFR